MGRRRLYPTPEAARSAQIERERVRREARRHQGLCPFCGDPPTDGCTACEHCRRRRAAQWRAWRGRHRRSEAA